MTLQIQPQEPTLTPMQFIDKWRDTRFGERQAAQAFFNDLCALVGHPTPADYGNPEVFTFEKWVPGGFADAYKEGHFGWEFKSSDALLNGAFNQLLRYSVYLKTPPLLIVSSFRTILIRTNFAGTETILYRIPIDQLPLPEQLHRLRCAFFDPEQLRPDRSVDEVTKETANLFGAIVKDMEQYSPDAEKLARYLNQLIFCLYAEDAGLLPEELFTDIVRHQHRDRERFHRAVANLFQQMAGGGLFGYNAIAHFNGDLFNQSETVTISNAALQYLRAATQKNWQNIEPSIFGTLFERVLDAEQRSQLGVHYTGADDIMLVVEPVLMTPLRREWAAARREVENLLIEGYTNAAQARLEQFRQRLFEVTVLDPACGSGNFLYVALRALLDLEKEVINYAAEQGWRDLTPRVKPDQMLGLETNSYAVALARTALWIGYIQWHQNNGFPYLRQPILTPLNTIRQTDAILDLSDPATPKEPEWPAAEFIIGNPPFLGRGGLRSELGDDYVDSLHSIYGDRLPNASDLCCYWLEKARAMIEQPGVTRRAGLLATQGIRGRENRRVLQRIKESGDIFMAYPDKEWQLAGATVHIAIVGFDDGSESTLTFGGAIAEQSINPNLTIGVDTTTARILRENANLSFEGPSPKAPFDISPNLARIMLDAPPNVNGRPNSDVVRPVLSGRDLAQDARGCYTIDFGMMDLDTACQYEMPFEYVKEHVYPKRLTKAQAPFRHRWWQYATPRPNMRRALAGLERYIATPRVSKHRLFVWVTAGVMCNDSTDVFAREDDYFFGILHSRIHEVWARNKGTQLRDAESGFRYTPTTCFETFPFPEPTAEQRAAIAAAAAELHRFRENWRDPVDLLGNSPLTEAQRRQRTLTNLYNQRPQWLENAHSNLDAAVAAAYGWSPHLHDQPLLQRLLTLNLERGGNG